MSHISFTFAAIVDHCQPVWKFAKLESSIIHHITIANTMSKSVSKTLTFLLLILVFKNICVAHYGRLKHSNIPLYAVWSFSWTLRVVTDSRLSYFWKQLINLKHTTLGGTFKTTQQLTLQSILVSDGRYSTLLVKKMFNTSTFQN